MKKRDKILNLILPIGTVLAIFCFWYIASISLDNEYLLPSVKDTVKKVFALFGSEKFYLAFLSTLLRSLVAFIFSFILALVLSAIARKSPHAKKIIAPVISITRALPTIAVVLLLLFWTNSLVAPVIVTMLVLFPTVYTQFESAFFSLDNTVIEASRVDGANETKVLLFIELPQIMPSIYNVIGSGISLNFKLMVAAEVIAQTANSIGYLLNTSKVYFEIAEMLAIVIVAIIFGVIIEKIFNKISIKSSDWK